MNEKIFGIENFNLISDEQYYYVFRALNIDDQKEINNGITSENGEIKKVLTNKQRYPENNKYEHTTEISLQEVWDHTKSVNYYKGTNCISLSSNANVSIDYGSKYGHKYLMIKIPKEQSGVIYNAGQYMISELNRLLDEKIQKLPKDSEIVKLIHEIENKTDSREIRKTIGERFKKFHTGGKFTSSISARTHLSIIERFKNRQAFNEEQQLEYSKLMGKLTLLELSGKLPKEIFDNINIASLTSTIGSEFSNREFVHYGEISSEQFTPISKINIDIFALLQVAKEQGIDGSKIDRIESKLIDYTKQGYELIERDGKLYYANSENEIELNLNKNSVLINENELKDTSNLSIEMLFEKTKGSISYTKAKNATQFVYNLCIAQRKAMELANVLKVIINDEDLTAIIDEIAHKSIAINDKIITRKNERGIQVSESVNIDMNRGVRKQFTDDEQRRIYDRIKGLSLQELDDIISNNGSELEQQIYIESLIHLDVDENKTREERLNRYYAETIVDTLDIKSIYIKAIKDKSFSEQERNNLIARLEQADCKRLVEAFVKAGISENNVSGYIFNILASNGYQGYTIEELSRLDNLDKIIKTNVYNTNLKGHVYPSVLEKLRGITDNDNIVGETLIRLRDYQQETIENVDRIFEKGKRFAGVVLPTGAGKSFVAMAEMLKNQNGNIIYIAPQQEILNQVQRHILKNIARVEILTTDEINKLKEEQNTTDLKKLKLPNGKILPSQANEYVKKIFPHLKMLCYQGLSEQKDTELTDEQKNNRDSEEKELRDILKNADANLIIFDELHRSGAKTWKNVVAQLIKSNEKANILGITATPIRDDNHIDMVKELAEITHTYTEEELETKQYLGYEMYLVDAIQRGLVIEPKIVSFDFMLRETEEYQDIIEMIKNEENETKKKQLIEIKNQIDDLLSGDTPITEHIKNNISQKENEEIGKIIKKTIKKKDGRYIVFLPQHSLDDGLTETQYFEQQEAKIKEILSQIDVKPEFYRLSSEDSKTANHKAITDFENSSSNHLKVMLAINKLNEGVHVDGINGEIMYRKINDGSTILYLQQLGRVIYSLDSNNPIPDENIPIVYDIYNNYLVQNMHRTINQTTPKSDLQKLKEVIEWMDKHGYDPDINSEDIKEARKAITLKKIQTKYKKYINGIDNPRLSKSDIYEIEQILDLAYTIDLFNKEIGNRIIPPGERDLSEVQLFNVTATQRNFLELYKDANRVIGNEKKHKNRPSSRLNDIMNILETLNSNDVFIDNTLIKYGDTLKDVIERCPKEIQQILMEELFNYDEEYPIGQEYNFAKAAFLDDKTWNYFKDADVRKLYICGIFEEIDRDFIEENDMQKIANRKVIENDFIIDGRNNFLNLNVKTGTKYNEKGYDRNGYNEEGYDKEGKNEFGFDKNGFNWTGLTEEEERLVKETFYRIITASLLLKNGIIQEGQDIDSTATISKLLIDAGYTKQEDRENICKKLGIDVNEKIGEKLRLIKSAYDLGNIKADSELVNSYSRIFEKFSNKRYEMALLGIIPVSENGIVLNGFYRGNRIQEYENLMFFRKKEMRKREKEEKKKRYVLNDEGYNENGEYLYNGKFYMYNPLTGKKADGTYAVEARDERGFNPDKTYKDTGEYFDENGSDFDFKNEEGIDVRYNFGKDGYYYIKKEDGTYVNTGLKYNPMGFGADKRHAITKLALDLRGFTIDGVCKRNNDSVYDENGFKQDGTYQETGELYHNGYNAYGVNIDGKDKSGKIHRDILFTQGYIDAVMTGKRNVDLYIKRIYKNINSKNYSRIMEAVDIRIYRAYLMYPKVKEKMERSIRECRMQISMYKRKIQKLEKEKNAVQQEIQKYKKSIEVLKERIRSIDPMEK